MDLYLHVSTTYHLEGVQVMIMMDIHHPLALARIMNWECIQGPWIYNLSLMAYDSNLKFIFEFASKSRYESYSERSLDFMFGMDLLNNELNGEITYELGNL
ncbi:unnamed protein product [Brassica rapa subsp. narinosa]|uniref:(rape) hypothetical protein n=1 Tax=Brassica napus TaxID=3708 RepID=A0A816XY08_BRANA|nr:unnamed protein product [Brassica napus]